MRRLSTASGEITNVDLMDDLRESSWHDKREDPGDVCTPGVRWDAANHQARMRSFLQSLLIHISEGGLQAIADSRLRKDKLG